MSELIDHGVIRMPFEMAMDGEISRLQFYSRAQLVLDDRDRILSEIDELKSQLSESRANDRTAMGYLADLRQIAGGDDFQSMVRNVEAMRVNAERYEWLSNHQGLEYPEYVVAREYIVDPAAQGCFSTDYYISKDELDLAIDAAMSSAKERGDD